MAERYMASEIKIIEQTNERIRQRAAKLLRTALRHIGIGEMELHSVSAYLKETDMTEMKEAVERAQRSLMDSVLELEKYSHRR